LWRGAPLDVDALALLDERVIDNFNNF